MIAAVSPSLDKVQQEFTSLLPQVTGRLAHRFRFNGPEAREEKIAEAVSLAWQVYQSARSRGRTVSASNLAFYAGRSVTSGRKMAGTASRDVLSSNKQRTAVSIDSPGHVNVYEDIADRRWRWPIVEFVAVQVDWDQFIGRCSGRDRDFIRMLVEGLPHCHIAWTLGISPAAVSQRITRLLRQWDAQGAAA